MGLVKEDGTSLPCWNYVALGIKQGRKIEDNETLIVIN